MRRIYYAMLTRATGPGTVIFTVGASDVRVSLVDTTTQQYLLIIIAHILYYWYKKCALQLIFLSKGNFLYLKKILIIGIDLYL